MTKPNTIEEVLNRVYWYGFLEGRGEIVDSKGEAMYEGDALATIKQLIFERDTNLWYIVTDFGGDVVMGGFETKDLALEVRQMIESQTINKAFGKTYAIEQRQALEK